MERRIRSIHALVKVILVGFVMLFALWMSILIFAVWIALHSPECRHYPTAFVGPIRPCDTRGN